jgi:UDP-glucose 4-epimerase
MELGSNLAGEVFNIGSGKPPSINLFAKTDLELTREDLEICHEKARVGDIKKNYADINKARSLLCYEPIVSLKDGLQDSIEKGSLLSKKMNLLLAILSIERDILTIAF